MKRMVLINGQWQGGGNIETLNGAKDIAKTIGEEYVNVPISEDTSLKLQSAIIGCEVLQKQISDAFLLLTQKPFDYLFTIGGGCDADVASIAYMNQKYNGCLNVIWLDAHGDLNSPSDSESHLFYGMPLRALIGDCPPISELIPLPLSPDHIIHIGGRDFDAAEMNYMREQKIITIPVMDEKHLFERIDQSLKKAPVYIHLDLDVLDPECFGNTPLPVENGLSYNCLISLLKYVRYHYNVVGIGIFEYVPVEKENQTIAELIQLGKNF